jgi:hypothetical protein
MPNMLEINYIYWGGGKCRFLPEKNQQSQIRFLNSGIFCSSGCLFILKNDANVIEYFNDAKFILTHSQHLDSTTECNSAFANLGRKFL